MTARRPRVLPAQEGNAGVAAAYEREILALMRRVSSVYRKSALVYVKRVTDGTETPVTQDASLHTMLSGIVDFLSTLGSAVMGFAQRRILRIAAKYAARSADHAASSQVKAMEKAGISGAAIRSRLKPPGKTLPITVEAPPVPLGRAAAGGGGGMLGGGTAVAVRQPENLAGVIITRAGNDLGALGIGERGTAAWSDVPGQREQAAEAAYNDPLAPGVNRRMWREGGRRFRERISLASQYISPGARAALPELIQRDAERIALLTRQHIDAVQEQIAAAFEKGMSVPEMEAQFADLDFRRDVVHRMAIDAVNKVQASVKRANDEAMGFTEGVWIHVPGQFESRRSHIKMNGKRFNLQQGMFDPEVNRFIHCAELPYCRCVYRTVIPEDLLDG